MDNNGNKKKTYQCGFDLTDISAANWVRLLSLNKLVWSNRKLDGGAFVWGFADGYIVTANNPITGEYCRPEREPEIGYASYIGVEGTKAFRDRVAKFIKRNATYIKEYDSKSRQFI